MNIIKQRFESLGLDFDSNIEITCGTFIVVCISIWAKHNESINEDKYCNAYFSDEVSGLRGYLTDFLPYNKDVLENIIRIIQKRQVL